MLTEEFLKDNLITAYFIDNDRENIEILVRSQDQKSVFTEITPFDENNEQWKILSKFINIDQLHEATYQKKKTEQEEFEKSVIRIAEKEGLIFESESKTIDTKFYPKILNALLENNDNVDQIFALKLAFFETKQISESSNNEAKKKLRQVKTKLDVLKTAIEIIES